MIQLLEKISMRPTKCLYTMSKQLKAKDVPAQPNKIKNRRRKRKERRMQMLKRKYRVVEKTLRKKSPSPAQKKNMVESLKKKIDKEVSNSRRGSPSRCSPHRMRKIIEEKKSKLKKIREEKLKSKTLNKIKEKTEDIKYGKLRKRTNIKHSGSIPPKISTSPRKIQRGKNEKKSREDNVTTFKSLKNFVDNSTFGYKNNLKSRHSLTQKMSPVPVKGKFVKVTRNSSHVKRRKQMKSQPNTRRGENRETSQPKGYFKTLINQKISYPKKKQKIQKSYTNRKTSKDKKNREKEEKISIQNSIKIWKPRPKRRIMKPYRRFINSNKESRENSQISANIREIRSSTKNDFQNNFQAIRSTQNNKRKLKLLSNKKKDEPLRALALASKISTDSKRKEEYDYKKDFLSFEKRNFQYYGESDSKNKIYTGSLDEIHYTRYQGTYSSSNEPLSKSNLDFKSLKQNFKGFRNKFSGYEDEKKKQFHLESNGTIDDYIFKGRKLGSGAYAIVRPAKSKLTGNLVAVKTFNKLQLTSPEVKNSVKNEVEIIKEVNHPCIVNFIDKFENRRNIHLVMEYAGRKNLKTKIDKKRGFMSYAEIKRIFSKIVEGVTYLHDINIVHCDLKLENIVVNKDKVKLVDFGFSRKEADKESDMIAGTPNYMSPELISRKKHWPKPADVWSLGVILYYMITKRFPFTGKKETDLMLSVLQSEPDYELVNSPSAKILLKNILKKEASERIHAGEILKSEFLTGIKRTKILGHEIVKENNFVKDVDEFFE